MDIKMVEKPEEVSGTTFFDCVVEIDKEEYDVRYSLYWDKNTMCEEKEICSVYKEEKEVTDEKILEEIKRFIQ